MIIATTPVHSLYVPVLVKGGRLTWMGTALSAVIPCQRRVFSDAVQDHMERSGEIYESSPAKDAELHRRDSHLFPTHRDRRQEIH